ncbi:hypothetical protein ACFSQ7_07415 [Paenibacillus rhizoplanae]
MRQSSRKPLFVYAIIMVLLLGLLPADLGSVARADSDYRLEETFETYSPGAKPAGWTIKTPPQGVSVGGAGLGGISRQAAGAPADQ